MNYYDKIYIQKQTSVASRLEQLAEEASEVAQAALKYARVLRGENPTSTNEEKAISDLTEEWTDLHVISETLDLKIDEIYSKSKEDRWVRRLINKNPGAYCESVFSPGSINYQRQMLASKKGNGVGFYNYCCLCDYKSSSVFKNPCLECMESPCSPTPFNFKRSSGDEQNG